MSKRTCSFPDCAKPHRARGYCTGHYSQQAAGKPLRPLGYYLEPPPLLDRFWSKVEKSNGCWIWTGARSDQGYGQIRNNGKIFYAHRVGWGLRNGSIPAGRIIDHVCWNRACVNPDHLRLATHATNQQNRSGAQSGSTTGVRGVYWNKLAGKYHARAGVDYEAHHLGYFDTIEEAEIVVKAWRRENMPYSVKDQAER